jgi:uncharacterized membrane protein
MNNKKHAAFINWGCITVATILFIVVFIAFSFFVLFVTSHTAWALYSFLYD